MADNDQSAAVKTVTKLLLSAEHYASISPELARFYVLEVERLKKKLSLPLSSALQVCPYCHTIWRPDNCSRRLLPKMKTSQQIRRLERKNADGRRICKFGKSLIDLHSSGANRLWIRCHSCGKRTFIRGASRPMKVPKADHPARRNREAEVPKVKKKKRNQHQPVKSDTKATDSLSVGRQVKEIRLDNCKNQTPLRPVAQGKSRVTNKKDVLKQKHSMLQNILKQKTTAASTDTSAALKSFLTSL